MRIIKFGSCLILISIFFFAVQPALADSSATVTATVQTELISLTASVTSIDYGSVSLGSSKRLNNAVTITNNGNVNEKIEAVGDDAVERNDHNKVWAISSMSNPSLNAYKHRIDAGLGEGPVSISKSNGGIIQNLSSSSGSNSANISFIIDTPTIGSHGGTFDTTVVFMAIKAP